MHARSLLLATILTSADAFSASSLRAANWRTRTGHTNITNRADRDAAVPSAPSNAAFEELRAALQVAQAARPLIDPMGQPSLARCLRKLDDALAPALVP